MKSAYRGLRGLCLSLCAVGAALAQDPTITRVQNAASQIPSGLPNYGVSQGALFVIYGSGLGGPSYVVADKFPLQTTIAGTSVQISIGGTTSAGILYYAGDAQVAAILPSSVPTGAGTVTVTYNGQTSAAAPITVVSNDIGIFTVNQSGAGDAIATLGSGFVGVRNAANPGETVAFWGTGLGPVTFDETNAAQQVDMTNIPVEAYVGGKSAQVVFRGRNACCAAVDTVYIQIPNGVSGCATPVVFKIGGVVSNTTTLPVATSGRTCTPTNPGVTANDLANWLAKGTFSYGGITLARSIDISQSITVGGTTTPGNTSRSDSGTASFLKVTVPPEAAGLGSAFDIAAYGSCIVSSYTGRGGGPAQPYSYVSLDDGDSISVSGPNGAQTLAKSDSGGLILYSGEFDNSAAYLSPGSYTITGAGGADIGSFTANLTVPQPLTWTNQSSITSVDRGKGLTVTWSGGDPGGYVQISGSSFVGASGANSVVSTFSCTARTSDGSFTVPAIVLLSLPPSESVNLGGAQVPEPGTLSISGVSNPVTFQASGLDKGVATSLVTSGIQVTYQ